VSYGAVLMGSRGKMPKEPSNNSTLWAFNEGQVKALTGLSTRQIRYWRDTGFFAPTYDASNCFYSFRDLVGLRTIAALRSTVSLQELRKIGAWLHEWHGTPWSSLRFYLQGKTVYVGIPDTTVRVTHDPDGQAGIPILMEEVATQTEERVRAMRNRRVETRGKVQKTRGVMSSDPVVAGTRVPTSRIRALVAAGASIEEVLEQYPSLTREDVDGALAYEKSRRSKHKTA